MYRDIVKKYKAWDEEAELSDSSGEYVWLGELACFASLPTKVAPNLACNV